MDTTRAPRYDEVPICMIVFECIIQNADLDPLNISMYLPITPLCEEARVCGKTMKLPIDLDALPGDVTSMYFESKVVGTIARGTLTGNEAAFKPDRIIETRMYSHNGRGITVKISKNNIHVTGAKDEAEDLDAIESLLINIINCNRVLKRITSGNETLEWFKNISKIEAIKCTSEFEEEYERTVQDDFPETPEGLDDDIVSYLKHLSIEYDDHDSLLEKLISLEEGITLFEGDEDPVISKFSLITKSKWMSTKWIPNKDNLNAVFKYIDGFTVINAPNMKKPTTIKYSHVVNDEEHHNVTISLRTSSFSVSGKDDEAMRAGVDTYLDVVEKYRMVLDRKIWVGVGKKK